VTIRSLAAILLSTSFPFLALGQAAPTEISDTPEATNTASTWLLDAAGPNQRKAIQAVYVVECGATRGSGFLLASGRSIVTNAHVIGSCSAPDVVVKSFHDKVVTISKVITDADRDLALLQTSQPLQGGLELGEHKSLQLGKTVTAWGYPLTHSVGSPLLTVGYVSGFDAVTVGKRQVKHVVVNGAFNPGNSGGPLFLADDTKVVGIVVWKQIFLPNWIQPVIKQFETQSRYGMSSGLTTTLPDGSQKPLMETQVIGYILNSFYDQVQVMIGEAISVDELRALLKEKAEELVAR
jgi:Trypsin-like peptidase domain